MLCFLGTRFPTLTILIGCFRMSKKFMILKIIIALIYVKKFIGRRAGLPEKFKEIVGIMIFCLNWAIPGLFFLFYTVYLIQLMVNKIAHDWIRTVDL